jgi:hypothetical protein
LQGFVENWCFIPKKRMFGIYLARPGVEVCIQLLRYEPPARGPSDIPVWKPLMSNNMLVSVVLRRLSATFVPQPSRLNGGWLSSRYWVASAARLACSPETALIV